LRDNDPLQRRQEALYFLLIAYNRPLQGVC
jgi:hypothetical protein